MSKINCFLKIDYALISFLKALVTPGQIDKRLKFQPRVQVGVLVTDLQIVDGRLVLEVFYVSQSHLETQNGRFSNGF